MKYFKLIAFSILFALSFMSMNAQIFTVSEVDASEFPKLKASFKAEDLNGKPYTNLAPADFLVREGTYYPPDLDVFCEIREIDPEVSVLLVIDQSNSMKTKDSATGQERIELVKEGATLFVNTLKFVGRTTVGITTFGLVVTLECPFTNDKKRLTDSIKSIRPGGGTDYTPAFCDWIAGADTLLRTRDPDVRRVVIFLTDGRPEKPVYTDSIINVMRKANIQVYGITFTLPMNKELDAIAKQTGGNSYECYTRDQLNNIYSLIALDIQSKQFCQLSWTAPFGCTDQSIYREAEISFLRPSTAIRVMQPYQAPQNSIAKVITQKVVSFDDPEPGSQNAVRKDIILKPLYSPFKVKGVTINPNKHFTIVNWGGDGQPPPFTIDTGQTRTITVEFTQIGGKDIRQAAFIIDGEPCPPLITLVGGLSQVLIAEPNGGEVFSTCDDVDIIWTGVATDIPVKLSYSSDAGTTWTVIDAAAKGLRYRWKPPVTGIKFLVKAEVADVMQYQWANKAGGTTNDAGRSIALQDDGLYFYITGHFEGSATFDTKVVNSSGLKDAYIAKYGNQGNIAWIEKAGSTKQDSANGVCVDPAGNAYITGTCFKGVQFGSNTPFMQYDNKAYCFVAKYAPDGGTPSIGLIGALGTYNTFEAWGLKVRYENGYTIVRGQYINDLKYPDGKFLPKPTPSPGTFTATFDQDMFLTKLEQNGTLYPDYSTDFDTDNDGNRFSTGAFTGSRQFGNHTITSNGGSDVYINKWGKTPGSIDVSDGTFIVDQPKYEFIPAQVNLGNCTLGNSVSQVYTGLLKNTGRIDINIKNAGLVGPAKDDFVIVSGIDSVLIPGEMMDVEIAFKPTATGARNAQFVVNDGCVNPVTLDILGTGICSGVTVSPNDCGTQNIGKYKDVLVPCMFKNTNSSTLRITPTLKGNHPGDFKLLDENSNLISGQVPVPPDACFNMIIRFEPTAPGLREAIIDFGMPSGCEYKESLVSGTGIDTDIEVADMDWMDRRLLTVNDTTIVLKNNSSLPTTLTNLEIENPAMTVFSVVNQSRVIPANDTIHIHVAFTPDQEIDYSNKLLLTFDVMQTKLPVNLHGVGVLPRIEAAWVCSTPVLPGQSSVAHLNVTNTSTNAPLYIESIDFAQPSVNYSWVSGKPQNVVISPNNSEDFAVTFHPVKPGTITEDLIIRSDATTGPDKNPIIETNVQATCDALGIVIDSPIDFGTVLLCENFSKQIIVGNKSGGTSVFITGYYFTNADSVAFTPLIPDNYEIPPYDERIIYINFNPPEIKRYETKLVLENSIGYDLSIDLIGEGDVIHYYTPAMDVKIEPGFPYKVPVYADIPKLSTGNVTDISLEVLYDQNIVFYDDQIGLTNAAPGWQWNNSNDVPGVIKIDGTGDITTPWKNQLFSLDFKIYLGDSASSSIYFKPTNKDCITPDTLGTTFHLDNVCFLDGRLITISPNRFALKTPSPSPASDKFTLDFTVAIECTTQIELINMVGERQMYLVNQRLGRGQYILDYSTTDIPAGTYFIRMFSGPFTATEKIIITK